MPLLILNLFNTSYYCVKQYGNIEVKAGKKKKDLWPVNDTYCFKFKLKPSIKLFLLSVTIFRLQTSQKESLKGVLKGTDNLFYIFIYIYIQNNLPVGSYLTPEYERWIDR